MVTQRTYYPPGGVTYYPSSLLTGGNERMRRQIHLPRSIAELKRENAHVYNIYTAQLGFYEALRRGELFRLFQIPETDANGIGIIDTIWDYINVNLFRILTRFTTNAIFATYPDSYDDTFWSVFEDAVGYNSSQGLGVLVTEPGGVKAIEPVHYRPLVDGHAILVPRATRDTAVPDEVDVHVLHNTGQTEGLTCRLNGNGLGALLSTFKTKLNGVFTFGDSVSDYVDLVDITREYIRRITLNSRTLNRVGSPHMLIDTSTLAQIEAEGETFEYNPKGMMFPIQPGGSKPEWFTYDPNHAAVQAQIEQMLTEWHLTTGIPASIFHPSLSQSGISLERQMLGFIWKVQRIQRSIESIVPVVAVAMGLPQEEVVFHDNLAPLRDGNGMQGDTPTVRIQEA